MSRARKRTVSPDTVAKARKTTAPDGAVEKRTGKDGKPRKMPAADPARPAHAMDRSRAIARPRPRADAPATAREHRARARC
jgi:hypothetical protein